ncbi:transmembrane amino acid transporter protein-domain-containing protein [Halteromyces radiatus]|uniref:transmembrane amino acid transporter protein-domain-containing protein n=1 Tax=Halteromyces radiatus TaxID=101107 RepID=UPI00221EFF71|nr:transmembrane amino acid transporter protein-domain-containing protein [Halteromyces radiatus]KAI8088780.1 transmembrane amino acid transporter protein-domain-containing protein [Halteromyces radiatus]
MDIPNNSSSEEGLRRIRNIHPSQLSYGATSSGDTDIVYHDDDPSGLSRSITGSSFSDRLGSFVTSYSRTSMNFMAENLSVPNTLPMEDNISSYSGYRRLSNDGQQSILTRYETTKSDYSHFERPSLYFNQLDQVLSQHSTVADVQSLLAAHRHDSSSTIPLQKKSSFAQSTFNSINVLCGIGILTLPMGFKCAGWIVGMIVFIFCCGLTNYTAKLLAQCLDVEPDSRTYGDLGSLTFGLNGRIAITLLFITELITSSVALVVLLGDGIDSLFPGFSVEQIRVLSFLILTPMLFLPVRHLSYTSLLGIISAFSILGVVVVDGVSKSDAPGSLISPSETSMWPVDLMKVPLSFGLIMAAFAGGAVFPTVYRDMANPKQFNTVVNFSYLTTALIYFGVATSGYLMFGSQTMQEITQNLVTIPEYNQVLNRLAVWLIAMNPIAKYGLTLNPVNLTWQLWLYRTPKMERWCQEHVWVEPLISVVGKLMVSAGIVYLAYVIPGFDKIMGLLGAFFSFVISGIFPLICHLYLFNDRLSPWIKMIDYILLVIAILMATSGTVVSFM